jgi:hypothetical protein
MRIEGTSAIPDKTVWMIVPYELDKGVPYPTFFIDWFPLLKVVKPRGTMAVQNPFFDFAPGSLPERLRVAAWRVGWDLKDLEVMIESCKSAAETLALWVRRVALFGYGVDYQAEFLTTVRDRASSLIDLLRSMGMIFGDFVLVGWNVWPKQPSGVQESFPVAQAFVDLWRVCNDLVTWRYVHGIPAHNRPQGLDALIVQRLVHVVEECEEILRASKGKPPRSRPIENDIIQTLREAGCRLTTMKLLEAMEKRERLHGATTVKLALAEMVRRRRLTNRLDTDPKGYGLPGWTD